VSLESPTTEHPPRKRRLRKVETRDVAHALDRGDWKGSFATFHGYPIYIAGPIKLAAGRTAIGDLSDRDVDRIVCWFADHGWKVSPRQVACAVHQVSTKNGEVKLWELDAEVREALHGWVAYLEPVKEIRS
jgi:hypothetical protein